MCHSLETIQFKADLNCTLPLLNLTITNHENQIKPKILLLKEEYCKKSKKLIEIAAANYLLCKIVLDRAISIALKKPQKVQGPLNLLKMLCFRA